MFLVIRLIILVTDIDQSAQVHKISDCFKISLLTAVFLEYVTTRNVRTNNK